MDKLDVNSTCSLVVTVVLIGILVMSPRSIYNPYDVALGIAVVFQLWCNYDIFKNSLPSIAKPGETRSTYYNF
jgi:hypothetical protein